MGILRNPKHERFCQLVASGMTQIDAYQNSGYKAKSGASTLAQRPEVRARIEALMNQGARRAELSRAQILQGIYDDIQLARKLGQVPAALKGWELMGKEMHRMFVDRREVGGPGDFDSKTEEELRLLLRDTLEGIDMDKMPDEVKDLADKLEKEKPPSSALN